MNEWHEDALCNGHPKPDLWFPAGHHPNWNEAQHVCLKCPVRKKCLETAMKDEAEIGTLRFGMWGGTTPQQRYQLAEGWKA